MNITCPCGEVLRPDAPEGRWAMDPELFLRQNPFPLPLHHAVLLTREGTADIACGNCNLHHEVIWSIVRTDEDGKGTKVRYAMTEGFRFKECPSCGMRWPSNGADFLPPVISASAPCARCIRELFRQGYGVPLFNDPRYT